MAADVFVELRASISDFQAKMAEARHEMDETAKKGGSSFDGLAAVGKGALLGLAGTAVALGVVSVDMADKFENAHAKLVTALTAAGHSFAEFQGPINATDKAMENLGFSNADTQSALAQMTIALQDPTKAMGMMSLAADIARARNIDLASAALLVEKASEGQLRPLKQAGIDLPIVAASAAKVAAEQVKLADAQQKVNAYLVKFPDAVNPASKAHAGYEKAIAGVTTAQGKLNDLQSAGGQIIDALTQRFGGQAQAAADTFGGQMGVLKTRAEDFAVIIGLKLIPIIESLMATTEKVIGWIQKHQAAAKELAAAIGGVLLVAIGAYIVATIAAAGVTLAATFELVAIMVAVAALAAGVLYLADNWSQVWADIKQWTSDAVEFVKSHIYVLIPILLSPLAPLILVGAAAYELATNWSAAWNTIKQVTGDVINAVVAFVMDKTEFIRQWWHDHMQAISDITSAIWTAIRDVFDTELKVIRELVTVAFDAIRDVVGAVMPVIRDIIIAVLAVIQATWGNAWNVIRDVAAVAWQTIRSIVDIAIHTVFGVIGIGLDLITGRWGQAWKDLKDVLSTAWNNILAVLQTFITRFFDIGVNIVQGLVNGVKSVDVGKILDDIWNGLLGAAKKILGIASPSTVFYDIGKNLMLGLAKGVADHMLTPAAAMKSVVGTLGGLLGGLSGPGFGVGTAPFSPAPAGGNAALGQQMAAVRGWTGAEWDALNAVAMRESGWNNFARNASSGAYGIAQALPPTKYPFPGQAAGGSDPATQIAWMLDYIQGRYGDPIRAWAHEQAVGWYDRGGIVPPGVSMMLNQTGANEMAVVVPQGSGQIHAGGVTVNLYVSGSVVGGSLEAFAAAIAKPVAQAFQNMARAGWRLDVP